jgi:phosphoribosylformylglycinamidine synthase
MIHRSYTLKREDIEARSVLRDLRENLGLTLLTKCRIAHRYDIEGLESSLLEAARNGILAEPPLDDYYENELPAELTADAALILTAEALPGQYDQRADSLAQCLQIISGGERPAAAYAKVYLFYGSIEESGIERVKSYLINPVDSREASAKLPETLAADFPEPPEPAPVENFFTAGADELIADYRLAMDEADLLTMRDYFRSENRTPTVTELRVIDTYWSDHCRHTTFLTELQNITIEDPEVQAAYERYLELRSELGSTKPITLMDLATIGAKVLRKRGALQNLDVSDEVNACSIRINARISGKDEDWLLLFKNETHNHPTEIEPFGGAATCIGGAIRDPLSGRAYVYQAMRVTGCADPRVPVSETRPGKLPQSKLTTTAAQGYSSYGNQIGLATGLVVEIYHPGYEAKRLEVGAVVGAVPYANVRRETPAPGDVVLLLGGRTGRDGIGGATGSSKSHNASTTELNGAEVQKGNAPEERKLQRLFRNPEAARLIKRCNDFGAGGVSVAIGELADGVAINLSAVLKKYAGLDATELAISESQERMAVVVAAEDAKRFTALANSENLECVEVAQVTAEARMTMRHNGKIAADISREFLNSNGARKFADAHIAKLPTLAPYITNEPLESLAEQLWFCSQRLLNERFDSSIGAGSVLVPYGGKFQRTPAQVMAALLPADGAETCSVMSYAFDPYDSEANPYSAAYNAVILSVAKLVAAGCDYHSAYLTFQEYFERLRSEPQRWGKPLAALLGALTAQLELGIAAIGGKDSMSGSYEDLDVPPTFISFAIAPADASVIISPEFKAPGHCVYLFAKSDWERVTRLIAEGQIVSAWAVDNNGVQGGIFKMSVGNEIGFDGPGVESVQAQPGSIIAEAVSELNGAQLLGTTTEDFKERGLIGKWEGVLCKVFN